MNILIVAISYNSNDALSKYLKSIEVAMEDNSDIQLKVIIGDHSESNPFCLSNQYRMFDCKVIRQENIGYLGGISKLLTKEDVLNYDYVIISNVDIEIDKNFFTKLINKKYDCNIAWIAPTIWSISEQRNRNPFIVNRFSLYKLLIIRCLYKFHFLHKLYTMTLYKRKRYRSNIAEYIYAGHGAFIILTKSFFQKIGCIDYPMFLYGEELYLAELIRNSSLKVYYDSDIRIRTMDHISTGKMKSDFYYECNYKSLTYIINRFYKNKSSVDVKN